MKLMNVVGARPNFVKIAPLLAEMRKQPGIQTLLVHTGQHYDAEMSDSFFRDLDIPRPDVNLGIGLAIAKSPAPTPEMMKRLEPVMIRQRMDVVVVVGDVNSTLAGALTAAKLGILVVHVEAGLRSFDPSMPEEFNRVRIDAVSDLLLVSEPSGVENLLKEGRRREQIFLVGNVMIDTLHHFLPLARRSTTLMNLGPGKDQGAASAREIGTYAALASDGGQPRRASETLAAVAGNCGENSANLPRASPHAKTASRSGVRWSTRRTSKGRLPGDPDDPPAQLPVVSSLAE